MSPCPSDHNRSQGWVPVRWPEQLTGGRVRLHYQRGALLRPTVLRMTIFTPRVLRLLSTELTSTSVREIDALFDDHGVRLGPLQPRENDESVGVSGCAGTSPH